MKRPYTVGILVLAVIVVTVAAGFLLPERLVAPSRSPQNPAPTTAPTTPKTVPGLNVPLAAPQGSPSGPAPGPPLPAGVHEETTTPKTIQYFPPPSTDLTGAKLGTQRVPGTENIGDIYQIYFDQPSYTLYMAVIEPDGLRSIWRLDQHGKVERVFAVNSLPGQIRLFGTSDGVLYVSINNPSALYRTDDGFATWKQVLGGFGMFWAMADDGNGTVYGTQHEFNSAILFRSTDDGVTWEKWKDFQKLFPQYAVQYDKNDPRYELRHLHDVIYDKNDDAIVVGTGDVARYAFESKDGGATWQKVWDEGFVSHAVVGAGNYLLGPDKLRGPGIVLFNARTGTTKEVWDPAENGYAGYVYSIIKVENTYYAAVHTEANEVDSVVPKFGIIASPDAKTWYPFLQYGPLTHHARTNIWLASAPATVYASINGALYAFKPLDASWFAEHLQFPTPPTK